MSSNVVTVEDSELHTPIDAAAINAPPQQVDDVPVNISTGAPTASLAGVANRRRLVVCIDGTSNQFSDKNTNVVELYSRIIKSPSQLTYYNSGVGTYAKPPRHSYAYYKQMLSSIADLAIASHIEKGYRFLRGFVTGALLPKTDRCNYVTHFRHALALDECRVKFLPEYTQGSAKEGGTRREVWFAGTHSDIGGGNKLNRDLNRGGEPLRWMMEEARLAGLSVMLHDIKIGIPSSVVTESLGGLWQLLEYLPIKRRTYEQGREQPIIKRLPHCGKGREIIHTQSIHWTVKASLDSRNTGSNSDAAAHYEPKAVRLDSPTLFSNNLESRLEGKKEHLEAIGLVTKRRSMKKDAWIKSLSSYAKEKERPELIWIYGGPLLLNALVTGDDDYFTARDIIRAVIGLKTCQLHLIRKLQQNLELGRVVKQE
ncbi:WD40 repeat protein [Ceratobasidium sp. AG-Ba]|nr:WD40 repeat protein [Ceratobasidium sp. AG-Ba]